MPVDWSRLIQFIANRDRYALAAPLPPLAIPTTLQDSLAARLDRLAAVKPLAQLCATLGREFSYPLLQAVSGLEDAALQRSLAQLVHAEFLHQRGTASDAIITPNQAGAGANTRPSSKIATSRRPSRRLVRSV